MWNPHLHSDLRNVNVNKVLYLARNVSKSYQLPNRKFISKDLSDVIHDQNTERILSFIKKWSDIFWIVISM